MRRVLLGLFVAGALFGQPTAFDRLKREAAIAKTLPRDKDNHEAVMALHAALRDWIESRLPQTPGSAELHNLEADLQNELKDAGLSEPETPASTEARPDEVGPEGPGMGYLGVEFKWLSELPDSLAVIASVFEDHHEGGWGYTGASVELSDPDSQGRRLLLTHYDSVQCASTWKGMAYSVYRLGTQPGASELLLKNQHGFWLGNDGPYFLLKPDELIIEFLDSSVDADIHNRTNIQRYAFAQGVKRLDPVAFQPQDFTEEWLTRASRKVLASGLR